MSQENLAYWTEYKTYVNNTLKDFEENTPAILTFGLASEVCEVFDVTQKEIIHGKPFAKERLSELGDVLWYLAAIELWYELPYPRYATYLHIPFELNADNDINLVTTQSEALLYASNISMAMTVGDVDDIQYNLNKLLAIVFDVCMVYGITVLDCMNASVNKMQKRHPKGYNKDAEKDHKAEMRATKKFIKGQGAEEILFALKMDGRAKKKPYKHIKIKGFGEEHVFDSGDVIVDFFSASNFIAETYSDKEYRINYSANFREMLNKTVDQLFTGYILKDQSLVSAKEMREKMHSKTEGNVVFLGKEGRPILMTPKMKSLDDLLAYVGAVKAKIKETTK